MTELNLPVFPAGTKHVWSEILPERLEHNEVKNKPATNSENNFVFHSVFHLTLKRVGKVAWSNKN